MHAALQQSTAECAVPGEAAGTMQPVRSKVWLLPTPLAGARAVPKPMTPPKPRQFTIRGHTHDGRSFRPSDWSERLAGAMSCFRPGGGGGIGAYIGYSPYCVPLVVDGVKCVQVSEALKDIEPMAWDFVMNFARDNQLPVEEVATVPPPNSSAP